MVIPVVCPCQQHCMQCVSRFLAYSRKVNTSVSQRSETYGLMTFEYLSVSVLVNKSPRQRLIFKVSFFVAQKKLINTILLCGFSLNKISVNFSSKIEMKTMQDVNGFERLLSKNYQGRRRLLLN